MLNRTILVSMHVGAERVAAAIADYNAVAAAGHRHVTADERARENVEGVDFQLLLELWHAGPAARDVALEMADRNRIRSERK